MHECFHFFTSKAKKSRSGILYVLDTVLKLSDELKQEIEGKVDFAINLKGIFSDLVPEMTVIKITNAAEASISGLTRKPASILRLDVTSKYCRIICIWNVKS